MLLVLLKAVVNGLSGALFLPPMLWAGCAIGQQRNPLLVDGARFRGLGAPGADCNE